MKKMSLKIIVAAILLFISCAAIAQDDDEDPGNWMEDETGIPDGTVEGTEAPIDGPVLWLALFGIIYAYRQKQKCHTD